MPNINATIVKTKNINVTIQKIEGTGGGGGGGGLGVYNEIPTGSLNGVNTVFGTEFNYLTNSLSVYLNGIRQVRTAGHYSESGTNNFTMSEPPLAGDILLIDYQKTI